MSLIQASLDSNCQHLVNSPPKLGGHIALYLFMIILIFTESIFQSVISNMAVFGKQYQYVDHYRDLENRPDLTAYFHEYHSIHMGGGLITGLR